jgi:pyroglutamyl-peptidase
MAPLVILQGFGPFGTHEVNPSERLVRDLETTYDTARARIVGRVLTCSAEAMEEVPELLLHHRPDIYLGVGLAYGRTAVAVERVAINLADYGIPDEAGLTLTERPIAPEGPVAYWSTLPLAVIREAWKRADVPGYVSNTAGTFLCNHSFYVAAHTTATAGLATRVGFIHVPALVGQVRRGSEPALPYQVLRQALTVALDAIMSSPSLAQGAAESAEPLAREP